MKGVAPDSGCCYRSHWRDWPVIRSRDSAGGFYTHTIPLAAPLAERWVLSLVHPFSRRSEMVWLQKGVGYQEGFQIIASAEIDRAVEEGWVLNIRSGPGSGARSGCRCRQSPGFSRSSG